MRNNEFYIMISIADFSNKELTKLLTDLREVLGITWGGLSIDSFERVVSTVKKCGYEYMEICLRSKLYWFRMHRNPHAIIPRIDTEVDIWQ